MSTNSTQSADSETRTYQLQGLDRTSWETFSDSFIGACGSASTMCHVPLICKAADYYASVIDTGDDSITQEEAMKEWNQQNNRACAKLATACSKVAGARAIVNKYMPGSSSINGEGHTITKIFGDGRGAWLELRKTALGGIGIDTAESYLSNMFQMSSNAMEVSEMISQHHQLVRRLLEIPDVTLDLIFKMHFLRLIGTMPEFAVVEDKCATDHNMSYEDTVSAVQTKANRIKNSSNHSSSDGSAMLAGAEETRDCYRCGQKGHLAVHCRVQLPDPKGKGGQPGERQPHGKGKSASAKNRRKLKAKVKEAEAKLAEAGLTDLKQDSEADMDSTEIEFGFSAVCEESVPESVPMSLLVTVVLFCVTLLGGLADIGFSTMTAGLTVQTVVFILKTAAIYAERTCHCSTDLGKTDPDHFLTTATTYFCDSEYFGNYVTELNGMFEVVSICLALLLYSKLTDMYYGASTSNATEDQSMDEGRVAYCRMAQGPMTVDSGSTQHIVGDGSELHNYRRIDGRVKIADDRFMAAIGTGDRLQTHVGLNGKKVKVWLRGCWHVPEAGTDLFSVKAWKAQQQGNAVLFGTENRPNDLRIVTPNCRIPFTEDPRSGQYALNVVDTDKPVAQAMNALAMRPPVAVDNRRLRVSANLKLWHHRLCHLAPDNIKKAVSKVKGMVIKENKEEEQQMKTTPCSTCVTVNLKRTSRSLDHEVKAEAPLEQVYVDNVEGFSVPSFNRKMGYLWVDEFSRLFKFTGVKQKSDFVSALKEYVTYARTKAEHVKQVVLIDRLQSDWAGEISQGEAKKFCDANGIKLRHSAPGEHRENGIVEKAIDTVKRGARAIHHHACFPDNFWLLSMMAACHILQFHPIARFEGITAYQRAHGQVPDVSHLRVIGCLVLYYNWYVAKANFHTARALKGVLVGYCNRSRTYLIYALETKRLIRSAEVVFYEHIRPFNGDKTEQTDNIREYQLDWGQSNDDQIHVIRNNPSAALGGASGEGSQLVGDVGPMGGSGASQTFNTAANDIVHQTGGAQMNSVSETGPDPQETNANNKNCRPRRDGSRLKAQLNIGANGAPGEVLENRLRSQQQADVGATNVGATNVGATNADDTPTQMPQCHVSIGPLPQVALTAVAFSAICKAATNHSEGTVACAAVVATALSAVANYYGYEPDTYKQAMLCEEKAQWSQACDKEMEGLERLNVFKYVPASSVPKQAKIIACKWVFKIKPEKYKARLVIKGFMENECGETFSPTLKLITLRLMFALMITFGWSAKQMDICNAFLNASLSHEVYMKCVEGYEKAGMVILLLKALYGLKGSPRAFFLHLRNYLLEIGLVESPLDACLFVLFTERVTGQRTAQVLVLMVGCWVDDLIIIGEDQTITWFAGRMTEEFLMEDLGQPTRIVGIDVHITPSQVILSQETYIKKVLVKANMQDCDPKKTPMATGLKLCKDMEAEAEEINFWPYRSIVACILFISICCRPDLCFVVKEMSSFLIRPGPAMVKACKRVIRYLKYTATLGLHYTAGSFEIIGGLFRSSAADPFCTFGDADWAGRIDDRKSTAGMVLMFAGGALSWWSKTLKTVCLSSQDAEYMAISDSSREVIFIRQLLESIGYRLDTSTLFGDNNGSIALAQNPGGHQKTKHIAIRWHFIRQRVEQKELKVCKVGTLDQYADLLTKALAEAAHWKLTLLVCGVTPATIQKQNTFAIDHFSKRKFADLDTAEEPKECFQMELEEPAVCRISILDVIAHVGNMLLLVDCWYKHGGSGTTAGYDRCRYGMFNICCRALWHGIGKHLPAVSGQLRQTAMHTSFNSALAVARMRNSTSAGYKFPTEHGAWSRMAAWISDILLRSTMTRTGNKDTEPARKFNYNYATEMGYMHKTLEANRELKYCTGGHRPTNRCPHALVEGGRLNSNVKYFTVTPDSKKIEDWPSTRISRVFYLKDSDCKEVEWSYFMEAIRDTLLDDRAAPTAIGVTQFMVANSGQRLLLNPMDPMPLGGTGWGKAKTVLI